MFLIKAVIWLLLLPFKILFWWVPKADDSYERDDDEWYFYKEHGEDF